MARVLALLPSALIAAREGMSQNAFIREARALGLGARDSEMRALYKQAQAIVRSNQNEPFSNPSEVPTAGELQSWPTRRATGIRQNVQLVYRDRTTGEISHTFYSVTSSAGVTRESAVAQAIDSYSDNTERYNQDLIGAIHTSAYQLVPFQES